MIAINILNYNNYEVTLKCIESIFKNEPDGDYHIFVIDNGSNNESLSKLKRIFSAESRISVYGLEKNLGFAIGNDYGLELCERHDIAECILSNSDIVFDKNAINHLLQTLRNTSDAVIVGPKILSGGGIQHSSRLKPGRLLDPLELGRFIPTAKLDEEHESGLHKVFSVSGCCFAVNIQRFRKIGAFDKNTFLYNEENILGMQTLFSEYNIYIDFDAQVIHEHGASSERDNDYVRTEYIKSTLYYWKQYRGKGRWITYLILCAYITKLKLLRNDTLHPKIIYEKGLEYQRKLFVD